MATQSEINEAITEFSRVQKSKPFHMAELTEFVQECVTCAPDSAGRELRYMRARNELDYTLLSRAKSLYQFV